MRRSVQFDGTRWTARWFLFGILAAGCTEPGEGTTGIDAGVDITVAPDTRSDGVISDGSRDVAAADGPDGIASPDVANDRVALSDMSSEERAADAPRDTPSTDATSTIDGDLDAGDAPVCACQSTMSLDCFFDPGGPIANGARPASDVGLADQICAGTFVPPMSCVDNVEIFSYDACNRTQIVVTGCYARTTYLFDASTHQLVGASTAADTSIRCRGAALDAGSVGFIVMAGEVLSTSCQASSCSLVCRLKGGVQTPTCVPEDAGRDVTGDIPLDEGPGDSPADAPDAQ